MTTTTHTPTPHEIAWALMQRDPELRLKDAVEQGWRDSHDLLTARVAELEAALQPFARWPAWYRQDGLRDAYAAADAALAKVQA